MKENPEQKWVILSLNSLERLLRKFPQFKPPERLKTKLVAGIPELKEEFQVGQPAKILHLAAAATAAVLIFALILMVAYGLSVPSKTFSAVSNDTSLCYTNWQQDTNYVVNTLQSNLNCMVKTPNEP